MPTPLANVMLRSKLVTLGVWNLKTIDVDGELDNKAFNSYGQGPAKPLKKAIELNGESVKKHIMVIVKPFKKALMPLVLAKKNITIPSLPENDHCSPLAQSQSQNGLFRS